MNAFGIAPSLLKSKVSSPADAQARLLIMCELTKINRAWQTRNHLRGLKVFKDQETKAIRASIKRIREAQKQVAAA